MPTRPLLGFWIGLGVMCALGAFMTVACQGSLVQQARRAKPARKPAVRDVSKSDVLQALKAKLSRSTLIKGVPHVRQKPDFCGEACAEMYLRKLGFRIDQDEIFARCAIRPDQARGCVTRELHKALLKTGFLVGPTWYKIAAERAQEQLAKQFVALFRDLERGIPSIVCMHYNDRPNTTEHFRLILGYDKKTDEVIYHEPAVQHGAYKRMKRKYFLKLWPLKYSSHKWIAIRMRLAKGKIKKPAVSTDQHSPADYVQHIMKLKKWLPSYFTVVWEPPFVVIGDESPATVKMRAARTVRWAVKKLKAQYFGKDPKHILNVWLFRNQRSYVSHVKRFFRETPGTPYGYYSGKHKALIMNISTGGGTLVHEIVHPFVEANFPGYRAWFNEGLGSLYEQCDSRNGKIIGLTNWRLAGLKQFIRAGRLPSFRKLTSTTSHQFYDQDPGSNYAQARYLMYYLQEKGLLHRYYHEYFRNRKKDPTGWKTLRRVLRMKNPKAFQKMWEKWVMKLRFP